MTAAAWWTIAGGVLELAGLATVVIGILRKGRERRRQVEARPERLPFGGRAEALMYGRTVPEEQPSLEERVARLEEDVREVLRQSYEIAKVMRDEVRADVVGSEAAERAHLERALRELLSTSAERVGVLLFAAGIVSQAVGAVIGS